VSDGVGRPWWLHGDVALGRARTRQQEVVENRDREEPAGRHRVAVGCPVERGVRLPSAASA